MRGADGVDVEEEQQGSGEPVRIMVCDSGCGQTLHRPAGLSWTCSECGGATEWTAIDEVLAENVRLKAELAEFRRAWMELREHVEDTARSELHEGRKLSGYLARDIVLHMDEVSSAMSLTGSKAPRCSVGEHRS